MTPPDDPLNDLKARLRETEQAARRLVGDVPPQGWATPQDRADAASEAQAIVALLESLRHLVPEELKQQVNDVLKQVLLLLRELIDWLVARMELGEGEPAAVRDRAVQDIPLD
jgi:hypothetical protein